MQFSCLAIANLLLQIEQPAQIRRESPRVHYPYNIIMFSFLYCMRHAEVFLARPVSVIPFKYRCIIGLSQERSRFYHLKNTRAMLPGYNRLNPNENLRDPFI